MIAAIDSRLLLLVMSMLTLGRALEHSGALTLIVDIGAVTVLVIPLIWPLAG